MASPVISTIVIVLLVLAALQLFGGLGNQIIGVFEIILLIGIVVMVIMFLASFERKSWKRGGDKYMMHHHHRPRRIEREIEELDEE